MSIPDKTVTLVPEVSGKCLFSLQFLQIDNYSVVLRLHFSCCDCTVIKITSGSACTGASRAEGSHMFGPG